MGKTKIEWTRSDDGSLGETWNPVRGCTKISPGCKFCYAEVFAERWRGIPGHPYEQGFDLRLVPEKLSEPLKWRKPRRVFVNSMSDLFHEDVPHEYIAAVFGVMALACHHTYKVLTKRADRMREVVSQFTVDRILDAALARDVHVSAAQTKAIRDTLSKGSPFAHASEAPMWPLPNVWLGVSVENQEYAEKRIPVLLDTPAAVRFISAEPLLGPVNLHHWTLGEAIAHPADCVCGHGHGFTRCPNTGSVAVRCHASACKCPGFRKTIGRGLDWVIVGGESGSGARPFDLSWARSIVAQCTAAGVSCFVKQLGAAPTSAVDRITHRGNKSPMPAGFNRFLSDSKGGDQNEWPEDLLVRQFPSVGGGV